MNKMVSWMRALPALDHQFIDSFRAPWRRGQPLPFLYKSDSLQKITQHNSNVSSTIKIIIPANLKVGELIIWFKPKAPDLIEQTAIAPDITGSGVLLFFNSLRSSPFDWYHATFRYVILLIG